MKNFDKTQEKEIFSRVLKAGRRTYFFDVKETMAGDYYMTITESKKHIRADGSAQFEKHKIYLYKEDFSSFIELFKESADFIINEKGKEVISERHDEHFKSRFQDEEDLKDLE